MSSPPLPYQNLRIPERWRIWSDGVGQWRRWRRFQCPNGNGLTLHTWTLWVAAVTIEITGSQWISVGKWIAQRCCFYHGKRSYPTRDPSPQVSMRRFSCEGRIPRLCAFFAFLIAKTLNANQMLTAPTHEQSRSCLNFRFPLASSLSWSASGAWKPPRVFEPRFPSALNFVAESCR